MWFLPSLGRVERVKEAFRSMMETGMSTPGLLIADPSYREVILPPQWQLVDYGVTSFADRMRAAFNANPDLEWYGSHQDDVICRTPEWDKELIKTAMEHGIASCNEFRKAPRRIGAVICFRGDVLRAIGNFFPEGFFHSYVDDVWETIGRELGIWKCRMDVVIEARHAFFGNAPMDDTYKISYSKSSEDKARFERWLREEKEDTLERIRAVL